MFSSGIHRPAEKPNGQHFSHGSSQTPQIPIPASPIFFSMQFSLHRGILFHSVFIKMYHTHLTSFMKLVSNTSMTMRNSSSMCAIIKNPCAVHAPAGIIFNLPYRQMSNDTLVKRKLTPNDLVHKDTFISKILYKFRYHSFLKFVMRRNGMLLYSGACDSLNYLEFMKNFNMPDTFFSWFLITELHVWMLMVRLKGGGEAGSFMIFMIVRSMWDDAAERRQKLGATKTKKVMSHIQEMSEQFNAAIIAYDEGLVTNDQVLAGAIWQRILQKECNDPELVEKLIIYVRRNIQMLDNTPIYDLINKGGMNWIHW